MRSIEYQIPAYNPRKYLATIRLLKMLCIAMFVCWGCSEIYFLHSYFCAKQIASLKIAVIVLLVFILLFSTTLILRFHLKQRHEVYATIDPEERMLLSIKFSKNASQAMKAAAAHNLSIRRKNRHI